MAYTNIYIYTHILTSHLASIQHSILSFYLPQEDENEDEEKEETEFFRNSQLWSNRETSRDPQYCPFGKNRGVGLVYHLPSFTYCSRGEFNPSINQPTNGKRTSMVPSMFHPFFPLPPVHPGPLVRSGSCKPGPRSWHGCTVLVVDKS